MALAEVSTIYETNYRHIPEMLRKFAQIIEDDPNPTETVVSVRLTEDGDLTIYGWGTYDEHKIVSLLERAKFFILKG